VDRLPGYEKRGKLVVGEAGSSFPAGRKEEGLASFSKDERTGFEQGGSPGLIIGRGKIMDRLRGGVPGCGRGGGIEL
jgi:hypothetical protein